jgi:P-type Cu2+ transporter
MKTVTLEVLGLFDELDRLGVEKRIGAMAGVHHASANPGGASVTVRYDERGTSEAALRAAIRECGYHCRGEALPSRRRA